MAIERNFKNSYNHIEDTFWKEVIVFITRRQSFPYAINFFFLILVAYGVSLIREDTSEMHIPELARRDVRCLTLYASTRGSN